MSFPIEVYLLDMDELMLQIDDPAVWMTAYDLLADIKAELITVSPKNANHAFYQGCVKQYEKQLAIHRRRPTTTTMNVLNNALTVLHETEESAVDTHQQLRQQTATIQRATQATEQTNQQLSWGRRLINRMLS